MVCPSPAAPTCAPYSRPVIATACWAQQWPNRIWGSALSGLKTSLENSAVAVAPLSFYSQWGALHMHSRGPQTPLASGQAVLGATVGPVTIHLNCQITMDTISHTPGCLGWAWSRGVSESLGLLLILPGNPASTLDPGTSRDICLPGLLHSL